MVVPKLSLTALSRDDKDVQTVAKFLKKSVKGLVTEDWEGVREKGKNFYSFTMSPFTMSPLIKVPSPQSLNC